MAELPRPLPPPTLRDRIAGFGDWREHLSIGAVAAVLVVVVVAVAGVSLLFSGRAGGSWSGGRSNDVALSLPKADGVTGAAGAGSAGGGGSVSRTRNAGASVDAITSTTVGSSLHVHAAGAVVHPGVVEVPAGSRVTDVVAAAGGPAGDADLNQVNLAALVTDGERVYVPRHGEAGVTLNASGSTGASAADAVININDADETQLESLPGVGPATAKAIADYRSQHGRFRSVDDLLNVRGIGPSKLEQIRPRARV